MRLIELYYLAFREFRKYTSDDAASQKLRHVIAQANASSDSLTSTNYAVIIQQDWIQNIEEGLVYVEKAIQENRQFIRTEGEVVQIEKVRKVSRASVVHLAKHSNLITRLPESGDSNDLIPEKLYVVEKLSDYLVYENRFLYMMLCYLRDFIQIRLDKIKDMTTTYQAAMTINKSIKVSQRGINYQLNYDELAKNDPFLMDYYHETPLVDRMENVYAIVQSFLSSPLMKEVSKSPKLKPPVVKTNVLRMNPNFRAALKLYDYVTSYNTPGYEVKEVKKTLSPLPSLLSDQVADMVELHSTLAYVTATNLEEKLIKSFENLEHENREKANKKALDELRSLKKRIIEMNEEPMEYILKLEKRNFSLEKDRDNLAEMTQMNEELKLLMEGLRHEIEVHQQTIIDLNQKYAQLENDVDQLKQQHYDDLIEAEEVHGHEIDTIKETQLKAIAQLQMKHQDAIAVVKKENGGEVEKLQLQTNQKIQSLDLKISDLQAKTVALVSSMEQAQKEHLEEKAVLNNQITELERRLQQLTDEKNFANGQYLALKAQQGLLTPEDDFTSRERFYQLEQEMEAYKKLFKQQWKNAKIQIRESVKRQLPVSDPVKKEVSKDLIDSDQKVE